jgi:superfamily I DNA/RNA helicase
MVLLPKIAQILDKNNVKEEQVLLLIFSRMSAIDLKKRIQSMQRKVCM